MLCVWHPGDTEDFVDGILKFSMVQSNITKRTTSLAKHKQAIFYARSNWSDVT
jgi:hypothetical protein